MSKTPDDGSSKDPGNIEQIREIILGPQKRDYDQRIARIIADLNRSREETNSKVEDLGGSLRTDIAARHKSLEDEINKIVREFHEVTSNLQKRIEETNRELSETKAKLQSESRLLKEQLSAELEAQVSALRDSKISREAMAEMLQEVAMKLKGIEVLEELTHAARKSRRE